MTMIDLTKKLPVNTRLIRKIKKRDWFNFQHFVIHSTGAENYWPEKLNDFFMGAESRMFKQPKNYSTCAYHFYLRKSGICYLMVDPNIVTWHAGNFNNTTLAIGMEYSAKSNIYPDIDMLLTLPIMIAELTLTYKPKMPDQFKGHRELEGTGWYFDKNGNRIQRKICPGKPEAINLDDLRKEVIQIIQHELKVTRDGVWGNITQHAYEQFIK